MSLAGKVALVTGAAGGVGAFGRIDLHHLKAGVPGPLTRLPELSVADFDRVVAINLRGAFPACAPRSGSTSGRPQPMPQPAAQPMPPPAARSCSPRPSPRCGAAAYLTGEVISVDGGAAAVSIVRPSGGAGAWDPGPVDARLHPATGAGT
ncbi:MAG TPA: hypothetical protein VH141_03830 [Pseudonocardia sp.]|nr:hypothetical protein [Pseudonocardia sp.]